MGTEIKELYSALQRFIERRPKMHIAPKQDDDDIIIANAFDELERLREENKRLRGEINILKARIQGANASLVLARDNLQFDLLSKQHLEQARHELWNALEWRGE